MLAKTEVATLAVRISMILCHVASLLPVTRTMLHILCLPRINADTLAHSTRHGMGKWHMVSPSWTTLTACWRSVVLIMLISSEFPYLTAPYDAINSQASTDGTKITLSNSDNPSSGASAASAAATAIVFINADSGEGYINVEGNNGDRNNLDPWHSGNQLVQAVANVNKNTIVVVHSVGPLILESIVALPNVVAIVWAGIPGQESGNGLLDVLYGTKSPSGKVPYTIAKQAADYGTAVVSGSDSYPEGLYIDYRHFDHASITPRYEFGYGLCETLLSPLELGCFAYRIISLHNLQLLWLLCYLQRQVRRQHRQRSRWRQ